MAQVYTIPTNTELRQPIQDYVQQTDGFVGLETLPLENSFSQVIETEERDPYDGMTAPHLLGADPKVDENPAAKKFRYEPLYFKETDVLNEKEILRARRLGTFGTPIDLTTELTRLAMKRAGKTKIRMEWCAWQALGGRLQFNENNVKVDTSWAGIRTHDPIHAWSDPTLSTPLLDLDTGGDLFDGTGCSMEGAVVIANRQTWRLVMSNQNDADLKALDRTQWGNFRFMFSALAQIVQDKSGAILKSYDRGFRLNGAFQKFLPYGQLRIIGKRYDGLPVGNWWSVPSLHNTDANGQEAPGYFVIVEANGDESTGTVEQLGNHKNPKVEITGGIYGGPNVDFESNVLKMTVAS